MIVMTVVVFEEDVVSLICRYFSTKWKTVGRKTVIYDELKGEWDMHSAVKVLKVLVKGLKTDSKEVEGG